MTLVASATSKGSFISATAISTSCFPKVFKGDELLQDRFGRRFQYLRLSITDMCNFRCNYCLPDGNDQGAGKNNLTLKEIETLVHAFARLGTQKIRITGGEPTLRKDINDVVALCHATSGIEQVGMTTNAYKLAGQLPDLITSGLGSINISADSLDPNHFRAITGRDKLQAVLDAVDTALDHGLKSVKLNTVLMREYNLNEWNSFVEFVKQTPVTWRFIELMETGTNRDFYRRNHVSGETLKNWLEEHGWQRKIRNKLAGPALEYRHSDSAGGIGLIMPYSKDFCASCNRLRVTAKGNLHLCLFSEEGISIRHDLTRGDVSAVCEQICHHLGEKTPSHGLAHGLTGSTRHLAMMGG